MARKTASAVAVVGRDDQRRLLAERHAAVGAEDALVPACGVSADFHRAERWSRDCVTLDDLSDANAGLEIAAADG